MVVLGLQAFHLLGIQLEALPEHVLAVGDGERRRVARDVPGEFERRIEHLVVREHATADAELLRFMTVERAAGEEDVSRPFDAHESRQRPVGVGVAHDSTTRLDHPVFRVGGEDAQVAVECDGEAHADRVTVDRRDHRLAELPGRQLDRRRAERALVG